MLYPVPVVMVSCQRPRERPNIITVAWAGTINTAPAMLSISIKPERYSYSIIHQTKEFVVNLVTNRLASAADFCGVRSGKDIDKFKEMKLTPFLSQKISAPGIAQSPVNIECRVKQCLPLGSHDLFLAEVVGVTVEDRFLREDGRLDLNSAGLIAYSHGEYFELGRQLGRFGFSVKKDGGEKKKGNDGKGRKQKG